MTQVYLGRWLEGRQPLPHAASRRRRRQSRPAHRRRHQPVRREDLQIGVGLLGAVVTLLSFIAILWGLSAAGAADPVRRRRCAIPGYLVWAALIYAMLGTVLAHWIGWPLAALNFRQQRFEADFRFNLVRVRENSEQIALLDGETRRNRPPARPLPQRGRQFPADHVAAEEADLLHHELFAGRGRVPYIMVSPAYFSGAFQLGGLMQTASAFNSVQRIAVILRHRLSPASRNAPPWSSG